MVFSSSDENSNEKKSRTLMAITGNTAKLEGDFIISESIEIDCEVKGSMTIEGQLIIMKDGFVAADVKTKNAEIIGKYEGSMESTGKVEIKETGVVNGSIKTDSLIINEGGIFSGNVERMTDTSEKSVSKDYRVKPKEEGEALEEEQEENSYDNNDADGLSLE